MPDEDLFAHPHHFVHAAAIEEDDVVDVRAIADELGLLQPCAHETLLAVDVELLVGLGHLGGLHAIEAADLRAPRLVGAVLLLQPLEPRHGIVREVRQMMLHALDLALQSCNLLVVAVGVEL